MDDGIIYSANNVTSILQITVFSRSAHARECCFSERLHYAPSTSYKSLRLSVIVLIRQTDVLIAVTSRVRHNYR